MDDLVNAHNQEEEDLNDVLAEEERRRQQRRAMNDPKDPRFKKQMKLKGMDQMYTHEGQDPKR